MLALSPSTRYCPYCHQTTPHQEQLCSRCGKSAELPETVQQALKSAVASTPLQVDPKGAWIDLIATLLTTAGLLCIGYSAIRIATRPLVFLAPIQTAYNRQLDDVEAIPVGAFWVSSTPPTSIVVSKSVAVPASKTYNPEIAPAKTEASDNGLVFGFVPHTPTIRAPWPPLHEHYATISAPPASDSQPHEEEK